MIRQPLESRRRVFSPIQPVVVSPKGQGKTSPASRARSGLSADPSWASVVLRMPLDTTVTDVSPKARSINNSGGATITAGAAKYGAGGALFNGTDDWFCTDYSADFNFSSGDFTHEFWFNPASDNAGGLIAQVYLDNGNRWHLGYDPTNQFIGAEFVSGFSFVDYNASNGTAPKGAWSHFVMQRSGSTLTLAVNGTAFFSGTPTQPLPNGNARLDFGGLIATNQYYWKGAIDDIRTTKGVARYAFPATPPTAALPIS